MTPLVKGQNIPLPAGSGPIAVLVEWDAPDADVDVSALLLNGDGKVCSDAHFVFYNQPESPDGAVRFESGARIVVDLSALAPEVDAVAIAGSVDTGDFGSLGSITFRVIDSAGRPLAEYVTRDASTETALLFGQVYRRGGGWKVRAVGQGWDSGLAGLATDFGVVVDDGPQVYRLWHRERSWCDYDLAVDDEYLPALRSLLPDDWSGESTTLTPEVALIPEIGSGTAVAVRADGRTIGYLDPETATRWAGVLRRVLASGLVPVTRARVWLREYDGWDGAELRSAVQLALGEPHCAVPLNAAPAGRYTLLPRSGIVQVTKEHEHFDVLGKHVPDGGTGVLIAELRRKDPDGRAKPHVEVCVDGERVGQLTPQMSERFLPMVDKLREHGIATVCWADIAGSEVAAKVRIDAIKANEAGPEVFTDVVTVPDLVPAVPDPEGYDLTAVRDLLAPLPPIRPAPRPVPPEPVDGTVLRFTKSGHYTYLALRHGASWLTTASGSGPGLAERMTWGELARRVRAFEVAAGWSPVAPAGDDRVRARLAVVRFTFGARSAAAVNIASDGHPDGDWYSTYTGSYDSPFAGPTSWSEIARHGGQVQVCTAWAPLG